MEDRHEKMQAMYKAMNSEEGFDGMKFEWCCSGRHGVIRDIPKNRGMEISRFLQYFFGSKCDWFAKGKDSKHQNVEFVHMTKVYPPPAKIWDWCGKTILFNDMMVSEKAAYAASAAYRIGDTVSFDFKGAFKKGIVANVNRRVTVIVPNEGKYYIPGTNLQKAA